MTLLREIAAAVVVRDGRVLVQTRPEGKSYGGFWEFPGGKLEAGEDAAACAVRECREELSLEIRVLEPLHVERWDYPGQSVRVAFLLCEPVGGAEARALEGQRVLWADAADLQRLKFLPANAAVLALLAGRLGGPPLSSS